MGLPQFNDPSCATRRPIYDLGNLIHFWLTPKAGGKVDAHRLTQVGRAPRQLGVQMIPACSPRARCRSERSFGAWQGRLPQQLRPRGITTLAAANSFLAEHYVAE